jgi:hypothetical protein
MRNDPFCAVILKSPYFSIKDAFRSKAGCFGALIVKETFNTGALIENINAPLLMIHGQGDTLIPVDHSRRLYKIVKHNPNTEL